MVEFDYTIKDDLGIHVRPAGQLAQICKSKLSKCVISLDGKEAEITKLFAVMALAVKCGDTVSIKVDGADEEQTAAEIKKFMSENL